MRHPRLVVACSIAAIGLTVVAFCVSPSETVHLWRGHSVLLVDDLMPESLVLDKLERAGIRDVLAASTQPVVISNFRGLVSISLSSIQSRLIPEDPRRDRYIEGLDAWFRASKGSDRYRVYYIAQHLGSPSVSRIRHALVDISGQILLPESDISKPPQMAFFYMVLVAYAALVIFAGTGKKRMVGIVLLLPWLPLSFRGMRSALIVTLCGAATLRILPSFLLVLAEYSLSRNKKKAFSLSLYALEDAWPLILPAIGSIALLPDLWISLLFSWSTLR